MITSFLLALDPLDSDALDCEDELYFFLIYTTNKTKLSPPEKKIDPMATLK